MSDVDADRLKRRATLKLVNLKENPLSKETEDQLLTISSVITVQFTPKVEEEWEKAGECDDGY